MTSDESLPTCCQICCGPCIQCCCPPPSDQAKDKYRHVHYKAPIDTNITPGPPEYHKVPVEKMFMFHQPRADYSIHPQITTSSDTEDDSSSGIVSDQPRMYRRPDSVATSERSLQGSLPSLSEEGGTSQVSGADSSCPTLQYSLYYDIQRNALTVNLGQAFNLPIRGKSSGSGDTSVILYMQPNKAEVFESKVVRKDLNPVFDQTFEFTGLLGVQVARQQTLIFKIYSRSRFGGRELVGGVAVQLEHADLFGLTVLSRIDDCSSGAEFQTYGDILFSLTYKPDTHMISGIILKATGLQKRDITGTADPYVKVNLFHRGKRVAKWRSPVKKHTLVPVFNEPFQFDVFGLETTELSMDVVVMEYDRFSHDQVVGVVHLGSKVTEDMGRTHWDEMIAAPSNAISRWHSIIPVNGSGEGGSHSKFRLTSSSSS